MQRAFAALVCVCAIAGHAGADSPKEQPLDAFLEQRVAEELATDGILLSRLGVTLQIQIVGDTVIVSLIDSTTEHAVASTKLDRVSGDREAAVAQVTQIASSLTEQISHAAPHPAVASADAGRAEQDRRDAAEYRYRQREIVFNDLSAGSWGDHDITRAPYLGEVRRPLSATEFFDEVERQDLAAAYENKRTSAKIWMGAGVLSIAAGSLYLKYTFETNDSRIGNRVGAISGVLIGGGFLAICINIYRITHPLPVDESDLYKLAEAHNAKMRAKEGLPIAVAPYATDGGGGLVIGGGF